MRQFISTGSVFEAQVGYSRAVVDGDWLVISGITGFDYATGAIDPDPAAQAEQIFRTMRKVVAEAGFAFADIIRMGFICTDIEAWNAVVPVLSANLPDCRPATTAIIAGLVDPRMRVEIEATALRRERTV